MFRSQYTHQSPYDGIHVFGFWSGEQMHSHYYRVADPLDQALISKIRISDSPSVLFSCIFVERYVLSGSWEFPK